MSEICGVAGYKDERVKDFIWLTIEDVKLVLRQPDTNKKTGIRDRFFIALMYESGCRDETSTDTPLSRDIVPYFNEYCGLYHPDTEKSSDELLFYTFRNGIKCRAMHLYLAGVPLPLVSEWLGHSNMETTQIYARATDEMKRQAQRKLGEKEGSVFKDDIAFKYADNETVLKKLAGLK